MGSLEILNVQGGEVKITFDHHDAPEAIRARRIISEMIRSGFVLLVEVERNKEKRFERAVSFDEARGEYIIADFMPANGAPTPLVSAAQPAEEAAPTPGKRGRRRRVPMEEAQATAVGPSAGG